MESLLYQTLDLNLPEIAQTLVNEYRAKGYETQQFGDMNHITIQLKKESTLRAITGFNKALAVSMQRVQDGTLVSAGVQDWVDQIAVGAVGLAVHPLLITAAIGAIQQHSAEREILRSIDYQIRQQQPQVRVTVPPGNFWMHPAYSGMPPTPVS